MFNIQKGIRRFILVECEDYADKITAERMRRVIKGVPNAKDEKLREGLGGSFSYFQFLIILLYWDYCVPS